VAGSLGVEDGGHGFGELVDVPVGVDVAGCLDRFVAEELLDGFQIPGVVEDLLAGGVAGFVHAFAGGGAFGEDAGVVEAAVPPVVGSVVAHWFVGEAVDDGFAFVWDRFLSGEEVVVGLGFEVEDQVFEIEPEVGLGDREFADLFAFGEDGESAALVVEVGELDALEGAFAEAVVE
jgi:hypothetical protein